MKELLISILEQLVGDEVYLQGTMNPDEAYPAKFCTFFTSDSEFDKYYEDDARQINWSVSVIFYSSNPAEILSVPPQIISALKVQGFLPQNAGVDILSDEKSHTGVAMDFIYPEKITN